jgi:predicted NUDIX family NTP pyrophosphohydrolase
MAKLSAGILMYREASSGCELLLVHPGGPFWAKKDLGAWSIPKGEYEANEDPLQAAIREFEEELGSTPPQSGYRELGKIVQPSRKRLVVFAIAGDFDPATLKSNLFEMEWPPKSGQMQSFPEVDRAQWLAPDAACAKILPGQVPFIDRLIDGLRETRGS